ncbi:metallophosphoesterase [Bacillus sonorensis]|uniref:metallophosphoesterase n=1 Tax=Bacillus sonorensis TaxID=119858 RepID=UPI00227F5BC4|nr:metallophosphoesterase [Bacillus sonorensis]MCY7857618.1 metallophosphoesterase [Bacillus sonorensis]
MKKNRNRQTLLLIVAAYLSVISVSPVYAADIQPISAEHVQPAAGAGENSPVIRHTPVEKGEKGEDLLFTAKTDADTVILYYKQNEELPFRAVPMEIVPGKKESYIAKVDSGAFTSDKVVYYIEARHGDHSAKTEMYTIDINGFQEDVQKLPELLITEMVVDSANVGGKDGYEFIEVYNNTNEPVHLNSYNMRYRHPEKGKESDVLWPFEQDGITIPSGKTHVFWLKNEANGHLTAADFNRHYGVHLEEGKTLSGLKGGGMANLASRDLVMTTDSGEEIAVAHYDHQPGWTDAAEDKAILYKYPIDGTKHMAKISSGEMKPSPGSLLREQTPSEMVTILPDRERPRIRDLTARQPVKPGETIQLLADIKDNKQVKKAQFFYRMSDDEAFIGVSAEKSETDGLYRHTIDFTEWIGKEKFEYYIKASDGSNTVAGGKKTIPFEQSFLKGLRLNMQEGDTVSGNMMLKATSEGPPEETVIRIDGKKQKPAGTALEKTAYFAFDVNKTNLYFKNAVTIGKRVQKIFDDTYHRYKTITVPVPPEEFSKGKPFSIKVRSGTKASPFQQSAAENRDDFLLKNPRLILADGTVIRDDRYTDPSSALRVGNNRDAEKWYEFRFSVHDASFKSLAFHWKTKDWKEGWHTIEAENREERVKRKVMVDHSGPQIKTSIKDGKAYKGVFTLDAAVKDKRSGIKEIKASLDGKTISLPHAAASADLAAGKHVFKVKAVDSAGNATVAKKVFYIKKEQPEKPEKIKTRSGSTQAELAVRVKDPTKDKLKVSFYRGHQYTVKDEEHVKVSVNGSETEPPRGFAVHGEKPLSKEERSSLSAADGQGFETVSTTRFPYHRFDVKIAGNVGRHDKAEVTWRGSSLPGRKVSMFAWNFKKNKWDAIVYQIAKDEKAFTLKGNIKTADHVRHSRASIIIQDQIRLSPDDYTFIWMSDTQYYAESYPHIFEKQVKWIAEQKDRLNIQYVFHTGDIVDEADQPVQWKRADQYMKVLDKHQVPYGVLAGNHDVSHKDRSYVSYGKYFGEKRFKDKPFYGGSFLNNKGHYDLISSGGNDYIMLYMGWGIGTKELRWLDEVLKKYPDRKAILSFHEFLLVSGSRSPIGDRIFEHVIKPNQNVIAVLSGHYHSSNLKVDKLDDDGDGRPDRNVYQMLADYQGGPEGGQGYLRIFQVDPKRDTIHVKTYSPYLDDYHFYDPHQYGAKDEFSIKTDLKPRRKKVKTDYFELNVFSRQQIGEAKKVKSGKTASVTWDRLKPNTDYFWYAEAVDQYGGKSRSDIWNFTTKQEDVKPFSSNKGPEWPASAHHRNMSDSSATGCGKSTDPPLSAGHDGPARMVCEAGLPSLINVLKNRLPLAEIGFLLATYTILDRKKHLFS